MFAQAAVLLGDNGPPVFASALIASFPHLLEARREMGPPGAQTARHSNKEVVGK